MERKSRLQVSKVQLENFCQVNHIRRLSLFGSVLREDFNPESDIDMLIEFEPGVKVGFMKIARMENELSRMLGRKVDLRTPGS